MSQAGEAPLKDIISATRNELTSECAALRAAYEAQPRTRAYLEGRAKVVDRVLTRLWCACGMPAEAALVAVGGYGRGELFPHSDVDLLFLLPEAPDEMLTSRLSVLVGALWDIGLEIGHSVRTIDDCLEASEADITVQTNLLEARLIDGDRALFGELVRRYDQAMDPRAFFKAKRLEQEQRYARYNDTPYALEPNCKESQGGLRDLQMLG